MLLSFFNKIISSEIYEYLSLLSDARNPIVFSIILFVIIFVVIYIAMRNSVIPKQKRMQQEKNALQANNYRLMVIFAELDPDPVIRINSSGEIIFTNPAAIKYGFGEITGKSIIDLIPTLEIDPEDFIKNNKELNFNFYFSDRYYSALIKGISYLNIAQFYLHDITELKAREDEQKEFSRYLQQKIEDERKRIARELHDDIGQKMSLLRLNIQKDFLNLTKSENAPELRHNSSLIEDITSDLKTIAHSLIPNSLEAIGLNSSILKLVEDVELQSSIKGNLHLDDIEERLELNLELSIYRIIQEAINNIVKYSKAEEFNIELKKKTKWVQLIISDDGEGFNLRKNDKSKGMGIRNMRDRAEIHGGTFNIISSPLEGTVIIVNFPVGG